MLPVKTVADITCKDLREDIGILFADYHVLGRDIYSLTLRKGVYVLTVRSAKWVFCNALTPSLSSSITVPLGLWLGIKKDRTLRTINVSLTPSPDATYSALDG